MDISARQKFKLKWVSFFTTATAIIIFWWWQAEKYKKFFDPFPCVEVSRLISISSQKVWIVVEFSCNYLVTEMSNLTLMRDFGSRKWHDFFFFLKNFRQNHPFSFDPRIFYICRRHHNKVWRVRNTALIIALFWYFKTRVVSCVDHQRGMKRAHIPSSQVLRNGRYFLS